MKEFVEKLIGRLEEKCDTFILSKIPTDYDYCAGICHAIEIVNQLAEEYNNGWIPYATNEELPTNGQKVWLSFTTEYTSFVKSAYWIYDHFEWANGKKVKDFPSAWKPYKTPEPYQKGEQLWNTMDV